MDFSVSDSGDPLWSPCAADVDDGLREGPHRRPSEHGRDEDLRLPSPVTQLFEGGRVSQTLHGVSRTLFDST